MAQQQEGEPVRIRRDNTIDERTWWRKPQQCKNRGDRDTDLCGSSEVSANDKKAMMSTALEITPRLQPHRTQG